LSYRWWDWRDSLSFYRAHAASPHENVRGSSAVAWITLGVVRWRSNPKPKDANFNGGVASRSSCSALRIAEGLNTSRHRSYYMSLSRTKLFETLVRELPTDVWKISKLTDADRHTLSSHWRMLAQAYEPKQFHVSRSGLALLAAYVLHLIDIGHATIPT
jgi:hypothetical protein